MSKKFLKAFISFIMCIAFLSTQVFASTEEIYHLIHSLSTRSEHGLNCIGDNTHNHDDDFIKNNENSNIFNQEKLNNDSHKFIFAENNHLLKSNQVKTQNTQITSYQSSVLSTSMLEDKILEYELFFAAQLMKKDMSDIRYSSIIYDLDNRPLYYLVEFASGGYAIILRTHSVPIELSYTSKGSPYSQNYNAKKYYVGMLTYAVESNGQIVMLSDNKPLSQEGISASKKACVTLLTNVSNDYTLNNIQTNFLSQSDIQTNFNQGIFSIQVQNSGPIIEVPNAAYFLDAPFGHNEDGDCGPTASAMLMRYYDDNINSNIINKPRYHVDDAWKDELKSCSSTGTVTGTVPWDEVDKINVYLGVNKPNLYYRANYFLASIDKAEELINAGKPVAFYGAMFLPNLMTHAVLAYGYQSIIINSNTTMFKIHNGWHSYCANFVRYENNTATCYGGTRKEQWISGYLLGGVVWIDEIPSSHTHNFEYSSDAGKHQQICSCGLKKMNDNHTSILNSNSVYHFEICKYCNYVTNDCNGFVSPATCTNPQKCQSCYKTFGSYLGHSYNPATCLSPAKCRVCDATLGTSLGHEYSLATCATASKCSRCGATTGTALGHNYSSATCTTASKCTRCGATTGTALGHNYSSATCTTASKCTRCGATTGTALGHNYSSATCTAASKCTRCGIITGTALGHSYSAATCTTASKCTRCGVTTGTALGHNYSAANCTTASKCTRCGVTTGTALGHNYSAATCTSPKKCTRCGTTTGTALGHVWSYGTCNYKFCDMCGTSSGSTTHSWATGTCTYKSCSKCGSATGTSTHSYNAATCTLPKTCRNCGITSGVKLGHNFVGGKCTRCPISMNISKEYE